MQVLELQCYVEGLGSNLKRMKIQDSESSVHWQGELHKLRLNYQILIIMYGA